MATALFPSVVVVVVTETQAGQQLGTQGGRGGRREGEVPVIITGAMVVMVMVVIVVMVGVVMVV